MRFFLLVWVAALGAAMEIGGELPVAILHRPYSTEPLVVEGGERCSANNVRFQVSSGRLPAGLRLTSGGYFAGTPRELGAFEIEVRATNNCGHATRGFTLRVDGAPILLLSADSLEFEYTSGGTLPSASLLFVSSSWRDMPYSIEAEGAAWVQLRPLRGRTPTEDTPHQGDPVSVSIDPSKLVPGTYRTYLRATAWQTSNEPAVAVTLVVRPGSTLSKPD